MTDKLEKLKEKYRLESQKDVLALRANIEATIVLLQAVLDKPENVYIMLDIGEEEGLAHWERYEYKEAFPGSGKGHHTILTNTYTVHDLSYNYAEALRVFLKIVHLSDYSEIALPVIETKETLLDVLKQEVVRAERSLASAMNSIPSAQKQLAEKEALLKQLESENEND